MAWAWFSRAMPVWPCARRAARGLSGGMAEALHGAVNIAGVAASSVFAASPICAGTCCRFIQAKLVSNRLPGVSTSANKTAAKAIVDP